MTDFIGEEDSSPIQRYEPEKEDGRPLDGRLREATRDLLRSFPRSEDDQTSEQKVLLRWRLTFQAASKNGVDIGSGKPEVAQGALITFAQTLQKSIVARNEPEHRLLFSLGVRAVYEAASRVSLPDASAMVLSTIAMEISRNGSQEAVRAYALWHEAMAEQGLLRPLDTDPVANCRYFESRKLDPTEPIGRGDPTDPDDPDNQVWLPRQD